MSSRRIEHITKDAIHGTDPKESNVEYTKADHKLRSEVEQNIKDMTAKGHIPELPHEWPDFPKGHRQKARSLRLRKVR